METTKRKANESYLTPRGRALIFVSPTGFRRVREYPEDWRTLAPAELWELSWRR